MNVTTWRYFLCFKGEFVSRKYTLEQILGILWNFSGAFVVNVEFQKTVYLCFPKIVQVQPL